MLSNLTIDITYQVNWLDTAEEIDDLFLGDAEVLFNDSIIL